MGNKVAAASSPLKPISAGVGGPIEDPIEREKNRTFHDVEVEVPQLELKSKVNPLPLTWSWMYYSFTGPSRLAHKLFETIGTKNPPRFFHRKLPRVPEIWECAVDDLICVYEAEKQFDRDRKIEQEIVNVISRRAQACMYRNKTNERVSCKELKELEKQTTNAWKIKYGEIGFNISARKVLNKQKNRFIETRYLASKNQNKGNGDDEES